MKKLLFFLFALLVLCLSGCSCEHDWQTASCVAPETCSLCGETSGEPNLLAHNFGTWETSIEPTCTSEGEEKAVCALCNEVKTSPLSPKDHIPGEWEVTENASLDADGTRVKRCTVCSEITESESFQLSAEEAQALRAKQEKADTAAQAKSASVSQTKATGKTVYRTPTGKRYHLISTCGGKNSYATTLDAAIASGLTPCKKCA